MLRALTKAAGVAAVLAGLSAPALGAEAIEVPDYDFSFEGIFGTYDEASLQRGYQVYEQVCASCHSMDLVAYRHLEWIGYSEDQVKALAAQNTVTDGPNDQGEMFTRPAEPSDYFAAPYPNVQAARAANGGAYPPDLSVIAQARAGGADYLKALLIGYEDPPPDVDLMAGMYYNAYFPGHQIAMPQLVYDDSVTYQDGTEATAEQISHDVSAFLMWAAEPHMVERKRSGVKVMLFLVVFAGMMYAVKRKVWADQH
ncbi:MAG: cytochrome c1 [Azospirillaceae bacterium]